jgi:hypothetical protein
LIVAWSAMHDYAAAQLSLGGFAMPTIVVNVHRKSPDELRADPAFIYVGRRTRLWPASIFGNPFRPEMTIQAARAWLKAAGGITRLPGLGRRQTLGIAAALDYFERYIRDAMHQAELARTNPEITLPPPLLWIAAELPHLHGRTLGCWCGDWRPGEPEIPCHALILARMADALHERSAA